MYKKAIRLVLRFDSKYGKLSIEQLWSLKLEDLKVIAKISYDELKKLKTVGENDDLNFLETGEIKSPELELAELRFDIVKDVYTTLVNEKKQARDEYKATKEIQELEDLLAEKRKDEIRNLTANELEELIAKKRKESKK